MTFTGPVERLPEIRLTGLRQGLGSSPVFYESETSVGPFPVSPGRHRPLGPARLRGVPRRLAPATAAAAHLLRLAQRQPHAGVRLTHYGATAGGDPALGQAGGMDRLCSTPASSFRSRRPARGATLKPPLDVNGLRQSCSRWPITFTCPSRTGARGTPQFDRELQSSPAAIDFPDYNSIDNIDSRKSCAWASGTG
ncbi:MAG: hypothetical protein CM1200mP34_5660 [Verrucomicrobiales bacterium]|nr:MAG: hypothetical protein CM1200mP34_5660 [Verrucomicrobiales bacterium]